MILGALGGICEVMLHSKIKESNAQADAMVESHGSREITDQDDGEKVERGDAEGSEGKADDNRFSWAPERMTTGLSDDSTLAGSDPGVAQPANSYGEQAQTSDQYVAWNGEDQPQPSPSRFVIDDVDSPGYEDIDDNAAYSAYGGHLNPPPAMPRDTSSTHQNAEDHYWNDGAEGVSSAGSTQPLDRSAASDGYEEEPPMVPPGMHSGDGYSPAVMPDEADYLAEYRQSQLYLQQDDDWYTAASASYGAPAGTA
ncbi:hypothetical protein Daus18300_005658 [Diaporthe australafricana]|uniref:Uncharacterized protein n=1 Tax=Diaporthe australafricana TaxID=127596 RepID=A0ABR3X083_9PEZI